MRNEKIAKLIKDLLLGAAFFGIGMLLLCTTLTGANLVVAALWVATLPFGWRWASKIFVAIGFISVLVKTVLSLFLGIPAIVIALVGDVCGIFFTRKAAA